jgi:tRNA (Thr-GGU) A37 N-methylase
MSGDRGKARGGRSSPHTALRQLGHFTHLIVLWWAHTRDTAKYRGVMQTGPPYVKDVTTGVFATRAPYRPNPVAMTTCRIVSVKEGKGVVRVGGLDAKDGTPGRGGIDAHSDMR